MAGIDRLTPGQQQIHPRSTICQPQQTLQTLGKWRAITMSNYKVYCESPSVTITLTLPMYSFASREGITVWNNPQKTMPFRLEEKHEHSWTSFHLNHDRWKWGKYNPHDWCTSKAATTYILAKYFHFFMYMCIFLFSWDLYWDYTWGLVCTVVLQESEV